MNKQQLEKLKEEYPVGAMIEIHPYRYSAPSPACYGIIVETEILHGLGAARCLVHTADGRRVYWSSDFLKVGGEVIDKGERQ